MIIEYWLMLDDEDLIKFKFVHGLVVAVWKYDQDLQEHPTHYYYYLACSLNQMMMIADNHKYPLERIDDEMAASG